MNQMFAAMLAAASAKLPYKRQLAYLESTGTQYIDTLIKPRDYLVFRSLAELSITNTSATTYWGENNGYWFGTANSQWTVGGGVNLGVVTGGKQLVDFQGTTTAYDSGALTIHASVDNGAVGTRNIPSGRLASNGDYYLFALNSFTSLVKMSGRLYSQKLYGDGVLVRDLIPVLNFNDTPCLYDKVSKQLFYNQGTGQFLYGEIGYKRQLAYLGSTGTQWINTGAAPDFAGGDELRVSFFRPDTSNSNQILFGSRQQPTARNGIYGVNQGALIIADSSNWYDTGLTIAQNSDNTLTVNDSTITLNGTSIAMPKRVTVELPIFLFCLNNFGTATGFCPGARVYEFSVYRNGAPARHLIPALDWNDIPCMYDKVSKQFFYNQGSGEFMYPMGDDDSFTIDLTITADNLQFGVTPYWNAGGYCNVDWGDGSTQAATTSGTQLVHTYAAAGSYRVKVRGDMYRFRVGSTNPGAVIDCNGNWSALGDIMNGYGMFQNCSNAVLSSISRLPYNLENGSFMFSSCVNAVFLLTELPSALTNGAEMFNGCNAARINISQLPSNLGAANTMFGACYASEINLSALPGTLTAMRYMFNKCYKATLDLDTLSASAPLNGWNTDYMLMNFANNAGSGNSPGTITGSIAGFMRKLPNIYDSGAAFAGTNTTTFGDNDYFEITLTTTEANQSWGFTATSSAGRWYCFDWGDGTAVTANKNLDVFTSGTKVSHTFATPGTYHIKLATAPCTIVFDEYDSDNGNWAALGQ